MSGAAKQHAAPARSLWVVTLTREITVPVYAETQRQAEWIAHSANERGDVDWIDADEDASAYPMAETMRGWDREIPYSLDDDDDRTVADVRAGRPPPVEERAQWLARRPEQPTPAALVEWLGAAAPPREGGLQRSWWGAVKGGAAASDGHAMAWAEGADGPADAVLPISGASWRSSYAKAAALDAPSRCARVTLGSLVQWLDALDPHTDATRYGTALDVALDRRLVERWVLPFARLTGECEVLSRAGERSPVEWRGAGWRVLTMPAFADAVGALEVTPCAEGTVTL